MTYPTIPPVHTLDSRSLGHHWPNGYLGGLWGSGLKISRHPWLNISSCQTTGLVAKLKGSQRL
jgi:hypothetical protein